MKLFALKNLVTGKVLPDLYFKDKQQAKAKRDELNTDQVTFCVTYGPDHRRYTK